jgi:formamidopyrimidine-DNA glycosylase
MPELPDLDVYVEHLERRTRGAALLGVRLNSPFLLRTVEPPLTDVAGREVMGWSRLGKQLVMSLSGDYHLILHLMIAGRLHWFDAGGRRSTRKGLAAFEFSTGSLVLTEAGKKKRASLRLVHGLERLRGLDPGGLDILGCSFEAFRERLDGSRHTLKRTLTDQRIIAGIGNAYSDEILHMARLSPFKLARALSDVEARRLFAACQDTLRRWVALLRAESGSAFPRKVTAFHPEMAVHGRYRQPCPACGHPIQRIVYAENEANYCAQCQTGGRLLADRALSRLLKDGWPRRLEDLE